MSEELPLEKMVRRYHGNYLGYLIGFVTSLLLTTLSFTLVKFGWFSKDGTIYTIAGLALAQAIVQLRYFLHLGGQKKGKWEPLLFLSMVVTLVIIVIGSLWIMRDLNSRTMPPELMEDSVLHSPAVR